MIKKIILLITIILLTACTKTEELEKEEPNNETEQKETIENEEEKEKIPEYQDNNPIKLGLFLYDNNYKNKNVLKDTYYAEFSSWKDIGSFEVFYTEDEIINGTSFKDVWKKYYNNYQNIDGYKIGYNLKFILSDGTNFEYNYFEPDIYRFSEYFYVYHYDDVHQKDGVVYSHLEKMEENTLMTSMKIHAGESIEEVENFILSVFTYNDSENFDSEGNYRGNSRYTIRIKKNS